MLLTPPDASILEGITRDSIIQLARELGHEVVKQPISRDQLYGADEVFVCGTAAEVVALRRSTSGPSAPVAALRSPAPCSRPAAPAWAASTRARPPGSPTSAEFRGHFTTEVVEVPFRRFS